MKKQICPGEKWYHSVFGYVTILHDHSNCIELVNEQGQKRVACGFSDRDSMLNRFEFKEQN